MRHLFLGLLLLVNFVIFAQKGDKISLFNGNDLDGWVIHGTEKWFVEDGLLVCESGPDKDYGYLATTQKFKDFDLTVSYLHAFPASTIADSASQEFYRLLFLVFALFLVCIFFLAAVYFFVIHFCATMRHCKRGSRDNNHG